jgi:hypothetical protein
MTYQHILKKALFPWAMLVVVDAFLVGITDVVHKAGWHVAAERFALAVVIAYPVSVAFTYRILAGSKWYRVY